MGGSSSHPNCRERKHASSTTHRRGACKPPTAQCTRDHIVYLRRRLRAQDTPQEITLCSCDAMPGAVRKTHEAGGCMSRAVRDLQQPLAIQALIQQDRNNVRQALLARERLHYMFASHADDLFVRLRLAVARRRILMFLTLACRGNVGMYRPRRPHEL